MASLAGFWMKKTVLGLYVCGTDRRSSARRVTAHLVLVRRFAVYCSSRSLRLLVRAAPCSVNINSINVNIKITNVDAGQ